jgi:hypothetical protein
MDNPDRMFSQIAAEAGVSPHKAKQALYLYGLAQQGRSISYAASLLRRKPEVVKKIAREFLIDLADYRPFAKRRDKGEEILPRYKLGISS